MQSAAALHNNMAQCSVRVWSPWLSTARLFLGPNAPFPTSSLQALNLGTYRALGSTGVYYGSRLGRSVPWVNGWPFSAVPHPQVGSMDNMESTGRGWGQGSSSNVRNTSSCLLCLCAG